MLLTVAAHAGRHGGPGLAVLILIGFGALTVYVFSVLRYPRHACPRCHGARVNKGKRFGMCKRCSGSGRTQRFGARAVHRFYWSVLGDRLLEKRKEKYRGAQDRSDYPEL